MKAIQLLKPFLFAALLTGSLLANDDAPVSPCEEKYDACIEKCDAKGKDTEKCYSKCDKKNEQCLEKEEENEDN